MKNFEAKGTGNSRFLKSAIPEGMSWPEAVALLRQGAFPIDLAGFNPEGIEEQGTLLNKANLLQDRTAQALELEQEDPTIDDALFQLSKKGSTPAECHVYADVNTTVTMTQGDKILTAVAGSNKQAVLYPPTLGVWSVKRTWKGTTATINYTVETIGIIYVYPFTVGPDLQGTTWADIASISELGLAQKYFKIGDRKNISINNVNYAVQIIGFNHDTLSTNGKAGITFQLVDCLNATAQMNSSNTNVGGWTSCAMRTAMSTYLNQLPSDLKNVIKTVKKLTSAGNQSATINTTEDKLFLLSEVEIFGTVTYSKAGEGTQYDWYKAGNSAIKKVNGSASAWWERSPYGSNSTTFCIVASNGNAANTYGASNSSGVAFGFCI